MGGDLTIAVHFLSVVASHQRLGSGATKYLILCVLQYYTGAATRHINFPSLTNVEGILTLTVRSLAKRTAGGSIALGVVAIWVHAYAYDRFALFPFAGTGQFGYDAQRFPRAGLYRPTHPRCKPH